jgi:flavin-dependent dehydrogenase
MTDWIECDIAILGGGPAGSAAALTLLKYSKLRPVIVERSSYDGWRVGETLSPGVLPLLTYLGAESVLAGQGQRRAYSTAAAWGSADVVSRDFLYTGGGDAWHLDRVRFDQSLATLVTERGGRVVTGTVVERATHAVPRGSSEFLGAPRGTASESARSEEPEEPVWTLHLGDGTLLHARHVIDATGRHASFARAQGAHASSHDHLTGLVAIFEGGDDVQTATLVEAVEDGWWYSVVAFMTDADVVRAGRLHEQETWLERLGATQPSRQRIVNARLVHGPAVCPAHSQLLEPVAGEGWIAAGEAAAGFDPLSSMGIGYALASGIQAARVAASTLGGDQEHARLFAGDVKRHFEAYLARRQAYYRIEQRWPESPFWARRQGDR